MLLTSEHTKVNSSKMSSTEVVLKTSQITALQTSIIYSSLHDVCAFATQHDITTTTTTTTTTTIISGCHH